jgi:RNA polymerase sigma-70 factor, ECF subfamily
MGEPGIARAGEAAWDDYVRRCASRDESALATLYDESSAMVYSIAMSILKNEADAAEVVTEVYHKIWESAPLFNAQRGSAAAWIVTLARSRAIDRRRSRSAQMRVASVTDQIPDVMSLQPSPENAAMDNQSSRAVMRALEAIPPEQRRVLQLSFFAGLSHAEIAVLLGEPLGTVKTRIRLAVANLRQLLKKTAV